VRGAPRTHAINCCYATNPVQPSTAHPGSTPLTQPVSPHPTAWNTLTHCFPPRPCTGRPPVQEQGLASTGTLCTQSQCSGPAAWLPRAEWNGTCHHNTTTANTQAAACLLSALHAHCERHCWPPATLQLRKICCCLVSRRACRHYTPGHYMGWQPAALSRLPHRADTAAGHWRCCHQVDKLAAIAM
jgi:hypothetical protein